MLNSYEFFLKEMPVEIGQLEKSVLANDWIKTSKIAHKIKPHFKMVGQRQLSELIEKIETLCTVEEPNGPYIQKLFGGFKQEVEKNATAVKQALKQLNHFTK